MSNEIISQSAVSFQDRTSSACEIIGYATHIAWMPAVLLIGAPWSSGIIPEAARSIISSEAFDVARIAPGLFCLLICCLCGLGLMAASNAITSQKRLTALWVISIACSTAALIVPFDGVEIVLVSISYAIIRLLWKLHVLNKAMDGKVLQAGTAISGVVLLVFAAITPAILRSYAPMLLLVSGLAFIAVSGKTFQNWVFVPREAMRDGMSGKSRKLFGFSSRCASGVAFGTLSFVLMPSLALVGGGIAWLISAVASYAIVRSEKLRKLLPKGVQQAYFAVIMLVSLVFIPSVPDTAKTVFAVIILATSVSVAVCNAISHYTIKKDDYLSDVYLSGLRHATDSIGILIGYAASFLALSAGQINVLIPFAAFDITACFIMVSTMLSLHAFKARDAKTKAQSLADPWHAKMLTAANAAKLTPRQTQIFDALSRGRNAKYIMERLFLSEGTVKKQIFQIYKKLDVHTQQDLITRVLETEPDLALVEKEQKEKAYEETTPDQA